MPGNRWNRPPFDLDRPEPGLFAIRMVRRGPEVAAKIAETAGMLRAWINGEMQHAHDLPADAHWTDQFLAHDPVSRVWINGRLIDQAEYDFLLQTAQWAARNPICGHPLARPDQPIRLDTMPPLF